MITENEVVSTVSKNYYQCLMYYYYNGYVI